MFLLLDFVTYIVILHFTYIWGIIVLQVLLCSSHNQVFEGGK